MIAILDYGSGNIRSAQRAFERTGQKVEITSNYNTALAADGLVIPGVGAFGACMSGLLAVKGDELIKERIEAKRKIFGICVGMQVMFSNSEELYKGKQVEGVGVWPGTVSRIKSEVLPHIGWNSVIGGEKTKSFSGVSDERFYFVHSYAATDAVPNALNVTAEHGSTFLAAVETDLITAVQFHPEKSGAAGLRLISNWVEGL